MATISSPGVGTNGLDVKSIISQLVALEKKPLDTLKLQAATVNTKISAFGQIKSLVSTLQDAASKLTSVTGWNGVSTTSSDSKFVSASAVGGTLPTSFNVEIQSLAKAQATASAALLPVGGALGAGTLRLELGKWSVAPPHRSRRRAGNRSTSPSAQAISFQTSPARSMALMLGSRPRS